MNDTIVLIAIIVLGILVLFICLYGLRERKKRKEEDENKYKKLEKAYNELKKKEKDLELVFVEERGAESDKKVKEMALPVFLALVIDEGIQYVISIGLDDDMPKSVLRFLTLIVVFFAVVICWTVNEKRDIHFIIHIKDIKGIKNDKMIFRQFVSTACPFDDYVCLIFKEEMTKKNAKKFIKTIPKELKEY